MAIAGRCLAQDLLKHGDLRLEIAVGNNPVRPGSADQRGVGEDRAGVRRQHGQEIEGPGSDSNLVVVLDEPAASREQFESAKLQRREWLAENDNQRVTGLAADRLPHRRIIVDREHARLPFARREARACCGVQGLRDLQRKHAAHTRSFPTNRKNAARAHDRPLAACANLRIPLVAMVSPRAGYVFVGF